jgi:polysaccharide export outer membrane protein
MRHFFQACVGAVLLSALAVSNGFCADAVKAPKTPAAAVSKPPAIKADAKAKPALERTLSNSSAGSNTGEGYAPDPNEYRIGALDLLEIKVLSADEMNRSIRVDSRGNINMPLIGLVPAAGLTGYELEKSIAEKLSVDYMQNPQVSVFIKEFTSQRVTVQGLVKRAGIYDFQGRASLLQAISIGGGLDVKANENAVKVIRKINEQESETMVFDLAAIRNNKAPNPFLKGGDVVVVEELEPITVEGAVMKAGVFYLPGEPTLIQVISQAGGLHDIADPSNIKVISTINQKKSTLEFDLEKIRNGKINDPILQQGDVVVVEKSAVRSVINNVTSTLRGFIGFGNVRQY